jgi:hypothetical protein
MVPHTTEKDANMFEVFYKRELKGISGKTEELHNL